MKDESFGVSVTGNDCGTKDFRLLPWQLDAVEAWIRGEGRTQYRGTIEIFTGGGKSLIALECFLRASRESTNVRLAVVVPTEALGATEARELSQRLSRYKRGGGRIYINETRAFFAPKQSDDGWTCIYLGNLGGRPVVPRAEDHCGLSRPKRV